MRIHNHDYFENEQTTPWQAKKPLTAWDIQGLSDAVSHLKNAYESKDYSKTEIPIFFVKHFARKL